MKERKEAEELDLGISKETTSRAEYKDKLFEIQKRGGGAGEVVGTYEFMFDEISNADSTSNPQSPYKNKTNKFLEVRDTFNGEIVAVDAFFTPDALDRLVSAKNRELWTKIKETAAKELSKRKQSFHSPGQSSSPVTEQGTGDRVQGAELRANDERRDTSNDVGGIDMNSINLDKQGAGVDIQFNPTELQELIDAGIDGFAPVIINITPLPSVLPLLGLEPRKEEDAEKLSRLEG
ncbi:MAG: hypothetical protein HZC18_00300 [Candidatus Omnitrophica bacterium]|nr:hypothetical protein [Candidatus Omnitrophota bacterium]